MPAVFQDHAVDAGAQLGQGLLLAGEIHGPGRDRTETSTPGIGPFGGRHGRKARVVEGGRSGVGFQVPPQGTMGFQGTDAAAQPAVPGEGDEAVLGASSQPGRGSPGVGGRSPNSRAMASRARATSSLPRSEVGGATGSSGMCGPPCTLGEGEGAIAHHPAVVAGGIAGIAQVEQMDRHACAAWRRASGH